MIKKQIIDITDLTALEKAAKQLASTLPTHSWIYLMGDLGTGKTTFCQYFIAACGSKQAVRSPTYALMQDYHSPAGSIIHCDLYRLSDAEELYEIGLLEIAAEENASVLVEWPSKGRGVLPKPDVTLHFEIIDFSNQSRQLIIEFHNDD